MCAVKTSLKVDQLPVDLLKKIMGEIRKEVPVGFSHHKDPQYCDFMPACGVDILNSVKNSVVYQEYDSALKQLGTLGGGNHFIEIQKSNEGDIWIMIHSGSRNLGFKVANHYNDVANKLNAKWHTSVPKKWELAFLPIDSDEGKSYIKEMNYCVEFALENRMLMMNRILDIFRCNMIKDGMVTIFDNEPIINIAHNYAKMEHHFGKNVMVHRKGATSAREGEIGIIPGSQGTKSYIVRGKGNHESFNSCSHGAGRKMGRKEASRKLNLENEIKHLDDQGIVHGIRTEKDLDEATGAYKDIDSVMKNQQDLVDILVELTPMGVIKG